MRMNPSRLMARLAFSPRERERCWRRIGRQMAAARLPLERCLAMLEHRAREDRSPLAVAYADMGAALGRGLPAGQAVAPWAGPEEVMLIDAGQTAGAAGLARGFARAAELMERQRGIRSLLWKELSYPLTLMALAAGFLIMIATSLMPRFAALSDPETWEGAGAMLYAASSFIASWKGAALALVLALTASACAWSLPRWTGRLRMLADRLPPWSVYRMLTGIGWLYATATLMQGREIKLDAVVRRLVTAPETCPYLRWRLGPVLEAGRLGLTLGEALCRARDRWPDPAMVDDLRAYSALPNFSSLLTPIAEELACDGVERVQRMARRLGTLAVLAVIAVLCLLVAGIFGIQGQITSAVGAVGGI